MQATTAQQIWLVPNTGQESYTTEMMQNVQAKEEKSCIPPMAEADVDMTLSALAT